MSTISVRLSEQEALGILRADPTSEVSSHVDDRVAVVWGMGQGHWSDGQQHPDRYGVAGEIPKAWLERWIENGTVVPVKKTFAAAFYILPEYAETHRANQPFRR